MITVAACQMDILLGNLQVNCEKVLEHIEMAAEQDAELIVFPELTLCGSQFDSFEAVRKNSLELNSEIVSSIDDHCRKLGLIAVIGFIENDDGIFYNTAGIFGLDSQFPRYRKIHLAAFGADQFLTPGNMGFPVFDLSSARIGINICYDQRFPESARALAIQGAQIIVVPTNETMAHEEISDMLIRTRAYENRIFYVWANRVGTEKGSVSTGLSKIVDPMGEIIELASIELEDIIIAEIDVSRADDKEIVIELGETEMHLINDRVPEYYVALTECKPEKPGTRS